MNCKDFVEFMEDYRSGHLPDGQRVEFERHMSGCPSCICYLDSYEKTIQLGKKSLCEGEAPVPAEVPEELIQAILAARGKGA